LRQPRVWVLGLVYFGILVGNYGVGFWLPQIVKGLGNLTNFEVGLTTALPYAAAAVTMYLWGSHSDRVRERTWHVAIPAFVGALGLALSAYWGDMPVLAFAALCLSVMGCYSALPVFWTLPTRCSRQRRGCRHRARELDRQHRRISSDPRSSVSSASDQ
jgi:MFS family permease